jgi:antitoxin component YwqK of YwqJK toxin-antitoxin module
LSGFADLQTKVLVMQHGRFAVASALKKEQELEWKREEEYRALNPVRPFTENWSNGQKRIEGTRDDDGNFYGLLTTWYKSGELSSERNYGGKEGTELISTIEWHKNGQKHQEIRGNVLREWVSSGELVKEFTLNDDGEYQTGFDRWVNQDGDRGETRYLDGTEIGYTEWYANGQIGYEKSGRVLAPGLYESEKRWYRNGKKAGETCRASIDSKKYELEWFMNGNLKSPPYDGGLECP